MTIDAPIPPIDYRFCSYTGCALEFRGPRTDLSQPFIAMLGSSEMHGRFVRDPFPDLLREQLNIPVANFGVHNAGIEAFVREASVPDLLANAPIVVVQVMGAVNMSNRFYTVHPRRNDRFLRHSRAMERVFASIDFSDFVFTRHMMLALQQQGEAAFGQLLAELEVSWISRMERLLKRIPGKIVLVSIQNRGQGSLGPEPLFVTEKMIDAIRPRVTDIVECDITDSLCTTQLEEMVFDPSEREAAFHALPPVAHEAVARTLVPLLTTLSAEAGLRPQRPSGAQTVA